MQFKRDGAAAYTCYCNDAYRSASECNASCLDGNTDSGRVRRADGNARRIDGSVNPD